MNGASPHQAQVFRVAHSCAVAAQSTWQLSFALNAITVAARQYNEASKRLQTRIDYGERVLRLRRIRSRTLR